MATTGSPAVRGAPHGQDDARLADRRVDRHPRPAVKDGACREVIDRLAQRGLDLGIRMRGEANDLLRGQETPDLGGPQIVLSEVHAAGFSEPRDIRAIVDDYRRARRFAARHHLLDELEEWSARPFLAFRPHLNETDARVEPGVDHVDRNQAARQG